jgi:hypothetical protein
MALSTVTPLPGGAEVSSGSLFWLARLLRDGMVAGLGLILLIAILRLPPAVRRRVLAQAVPVAMAGGLTAWAFRGFLESSQQFVRPILLAAPQWAVLALLPAVGFAAGMLVISRHERTLRSLAAGKRRAG